MGNAHRHVGKYGDAIPWLEVSPNLMACISLVTSYSLLAREEEARYAAQELLRVNPKFAVDVWTKTMPYKNQGKVLFADALRKAGLK